jgi:hypothetical protein
MGAMGNDTQALSFEKEINPRIYSNSSSFEMINWTLSQLIKI